ncbi:UDP-4-amino-4,6-dideoxy-N-acetyl-beta-L-altrosamine transaminase [Glaciecola siphonariae]|uniref:UDP-4-amino-4, 6-dideoxy-N-acetyl-beta-L-altrosamine transaminase n=1 Tax=Glaciecola siphonariae TaxID=521012 RepID=A0ABV9LVQ3_9ALTE
MISYGKHNIDANDIDAVVDVLQNHFLTQGAKVPEFEQALCAYTGASFCTAVNSGTSGLHVACLALGIGAKDIVWTSPNSFAASANCALYCGADVDFVDIDPQSRNLCPIKLEQKLLAAQQAGKLPKALVLVHFAGQSCDLQTIHALCSPLNIAIIEDAAHSLGAQYNNKPIGSCEFSDMAVFSFHPVKSITTAEGGAIVTNNADLARACALFAKHGITRDPALMQGEIDGPWYYQQLVLGYNYRLSDMQAALGLSQLTRLDDFIEQRRVIAQRYFERLADLPLALPQAKVLQSSSWHLFMVELTEHQRKNVYQQLHDLGIGVNVHYIPIHCHPYYQALGFERDDFPAAVKFYENALTLPIYAGLSAAEQDRVILALQQVLR